MNLYGSNPGNSVPPHVLNYWASSAFWRDCELIADDFARAAMGTELRWDILALFYWWRTDFNRKKCLDPFEIGFEGSASDNAINATLHVINSGFKDVKELPLTEVEIPSFNMLVLRWEAEASRILLSRQSGQPLPKPEPVKPVEQPKPEPKPVEPPVIIVPKDNIPAVPEVPAKPFSWKWAGGLAAVLSGVAIVAQVFLPGWVNMVLQAVIGILKAIGAM